MIVVSVDGYTSRSPPDRRGGGDAVVAEDGAIQ
jgi:hypothetical protein